MSVSPDHHRITFSKEVLEVFPEVLEETAPSWLQLLAWHVFVEVVKCCVDEGKKKHGDNHADPNLARGEKYYVTVLLAHVCDHSHIHMVQLILSFMQGVGCYLTGKM